MLFLLSVVLLLVGGAVAASGQFADAFGPNASGRVRGAVEQPAGFLTIFGTVSYCSDPALPPAPNVTLNLTGDATDSTITADSGGYGFVSLASGGNYTVTPTKSALTPGSAGIDTVDVVATQRHFLKIGTPLSGCQSDAADVNGDKVINTIDVAAIWRFYLGRTTGIANTGKYEFSPASRTYQGLTDDQFDQNYDTLIFGDVASPLGFDPNANGTVYAIVVQPDGKILIGGDFTTLSPNGGTAVPRNHIARLNPNGTLDVAFDPNANNSVRTIALQADGKILAGGLFNGTNSIGGQTRNYMARLDAVTGSADSFDPNANWNVYASAVQADGRILAGGGFGGIGGNARSGMARLDPTTGQADSYDPNLDGNVVSMAMQAGGKTVACGFFFHVGGQPRNSIAQLNPDGTLDLNFDAHALPPYFRLDGLPEESVRTIAVQTDGKILAGGYFHGNNSIGLQSRFFIARLDGTTGLADAFDPHANGPVRAITVQSNGQVLAGGLFNGTNSIGGQPRNYVARLDATTGLADSFDPHSNGSVYAIVEQADGKILAGGDFTTLTPNGGVTVTRNHIVRLNPDGTLDTTWNPNASGAVPSVALQASRATTGEVPATVGAVALPQVSVDTSVTDFIVQVTTTAVEAKNKLVGFQGDFTFDERMVTFQRQPVQKAGITGGNWNVAGNVLPGTGPIRTLRLSAYSNDFTPLSGVGALFELKMTRVSKAAQGTQLIWAAAPNNFLFIDADLNTQKPANAAPGIVTPSGQRK